MTKTDIAKVLIKLTNTIDDCIGGCLIPCWDDLSLNYRESVIIYITKIINTEYNNAEDWHNNDWLKEKIKDGWIYGYTHNSKAKISHEIKEFDKLDLNLQLLYNIMFDTTIALKPFLKDIQ
jgi:hypothetical protein